MAKIHKKILRYDTNLVKINVIHLDMPALVWLSPLNDIPEF